jgi:hypothetical protein
MRNAIDTMNSLLIMLALTLGTTRPAVGELWCGSGPGAPLDHPCAGDNDRFDRTLAEHARKLAEWSKIPYLAYFADR